VSRLRLVNYNALCDVMFFFCIHFDCFLCFSFHFFYAALFSAFCYPLSLRVCNYAFTKSFLYLPFYLLSPHSSISVLLSFLSYFQILLIITFFDLHGRCSHYVFWCCSFLIVFVYVPLTDRLFLRLICFDGLSFLCAYCL